MNPALIDSMSWEMAEVYGAVTDQILINLARYFPYYDAQNLPRSSFTYQADMLAQMGKVNAETVAIIRKNLVGVDKYVSAYLEQAIMDSVEDVNPELWGAVKKGIFMPPTTPVLAPNQYRAYQLYYTQAANKLNLVNTVMLESTQQAYAATVSDIAARVQATQTALDIGAGEVVTGVSSWNTATAHAINRLQKNGITGFIDHAGHRWSAEAYVAMDIRTTMFNTGRAAVWETNQNFGNDLYQVSYHNGARPLCYPWQSKVISSTDNARTVADLDGNEVHVYAQSETSYGEAAGLFGINCKHYPTPFIPGVSIIREGAQDEAENAKTYEESQQQRAMERKIREEKRDLLMLKEQGVPDDLIKAQRAKIRQTDDEIDDFCNATGRARRQNREGVYTKREFPAADTYDVTTFVDKQKQLVEDYYKQGGSQSNFTFGQLQQKTDDIDSRIKALEEERTKLNKQSRFDDSEELKQKRYEVQRQIDELEADKLQKGIGEQQTQKTKQNVETDNVRKDAIAEYDKKIAKLERRRLALIESGTEDFETTDKLFANIEDLKAKKKVLENGGWTIEQAKLTQQSNRIVNPGSTSEIVLDSADVYTMPDGTQFVFKKGMVKAHQRLKPEELIDKYYEVPEAVRRQGQKVINVVDRYNPHDAYWQKEYKKVGYSFKHSYATGGEQMTFYRWDYEHDMEYVKTSIEHEMGHLVDRANGRISATQEWAEAMKLDKTLSGKDSWRDYGATRPAEDFADSVAYYTDANDQFRKTFPNRTKILERIIGGAK